MRDRSFENQRYRAFGLTLVTAAIVLWNTVCLERAIGANASGKSAILDALRFLREGIHEGDFASPVRRRGNMVYLAWKGEPANQITLETQFSGENGSELSWLVKFQKAGYDFVVVEERIHRRASPGRPPEELLRVNEGQGSWWSGHGTSRPPPQPPVCMPWRRPLPGTVTSHAGGVVQLRCNSRDIVAG
jgi:hypothetical protein